MKYFPFIITLAFFTTCFCSCKKETKTSPGTSSLLIGKWQEGLTIDTTYYTALGSKTIDTFSRPDPVFYQFNTDGTGSGSLETIVEEKFNYKVINSNLVFFNNVSLVSGSDMFYTSPGRTERILSLTLTQLVLDERDTVVSQESNYTSASRIYYTKVQ